MVIVEYGCMGEEGIKGGGFRLSDLDMTKLIDGDDDDDDEPQPPVLVPESHRSLAMDVQEESPNELWNLPDNQLMETLDRLKKNIAITSRLKDGGDKFLISIKRHENELKRRQLLPCQKNVDDGLKKPPELQNENGNGVSNDVPNRASSAVSTFALCLNKRMDQKKASTAEAAFRNELSVLNRCKSPKMWSDKQVSPSGRKKRRFSSRESPIQSPGNPPLNLDENPRSSGSKKDTTPATSLHLPEQDSLVLTRETAHRSQHFPRLRRRKGETVVLVDEEELDVEETTPQRNEVHECENTILYYPSRKDPGSIAIRYSDISCLAPEAYLSSPIMNFYIRYLEKEGVALKNAVDYHFFNTYFYDKLKEAVDKKNPDENAFAKFRRWWKGVHIFEKAYIFLPIHEHLHWSLVIVCMPDMEDRSGIMLLHLDSLGLHCSSSILSNVKSFLIKEWEFLREVEVLVDPPIADTVWENLRRRIFEQTIEVPQQRNDYDCGLFVLFFVERFIKDAPRRLTRKDLLKFGRNWFDPLDASRLRQTIGSLLEEKFKHASEEHQVLDP